MQTKAAGQDTTTSAAPIQIFVPGLPKTAGSKRAFVIRPKGGGKPMAIVTDACKASKDWKGDVKRFVSAEYSAAPMIQPLRVTMTFVLPRPKGHFGKGKNAAMLAGTAPAYPAGKPDVLKLARAVEDACTGILWKDDAQIVTEILYKVFAGKWTVEQPGVLIFVETL